ncbi:hypothetical protein GCM10009639_33080 [Kitasatospora putterlickiae]|uniref:Uncharacterized protein n=1 Tax=Kitasatospora putterlickiae TaxID=221725 RepID=A0ABP4IVG4_9ACTN
MRTALRRARRRLPLRRWARRTGCYLVDGLFWLGVAMGAPTSPDALPGARGAEEPLPPPEVPQWHPERAGARPAPLTRYEEELWARLLER